MAHAVTNRIHAKGPFEYEEYNTDEAGILPGHLVKLNTSGNIIRHDVPEGRNERMFAQEDALQGKTIDQAYANGDLAGVILPGIGSQVIAWLADDQVCHIGDHLVSNGDGTLRVEDQGSGFTDTNIVAVAMEDIDTVNDSATSNAARIRVRAAA